MARLVVNEEKKYNLGMTVKDYLTEIVGYRMPDIRSGYVGIEVELEGRLRVAEGRTSWDVKEDHSLRNGGLEFVLRTPSDPIKIPSYIEELKKILSRSSIQPSLRTSIHVHVCVLGYTLRSLYSLLMLYWVFENILVRINGKEREGNLHCLRLTDCESLMDNAMQELNEWPFLKNSSNELRYAALNLAALVKFGSVEYRFMALTPNLDDVEMWSSGLARFSQIAGSTPWSEILQWAIQDPKKSLPHFFGGEIADLAIQKCGEAFCREQTQVHLDRILMLISKLEILDQRLREKRFKSERDEDLEDASSESRRTEGMWQFYTNNLSEEEWLQQNAPTTLSSSFAPFPSLNNTPVEVEDNDD